jgi:hypothetical protein
MKSSSRSLRKSVFSKQKWTSRRQSASCARGVFGNGGLKLAIVVHVNFSPLPGGLPPPAEALTNNERIGRANQDQWLAIRA